MAAGTPISVDEYLRAVCEPDCEYEDGILIERNVGESPHSWLQGLLCAFLWGHSKQWGILPYPEQRVHIRPGKYLIPDIYVHRGAKPAAKVFTEPPLVWIEILSSEDKPVRVTRKVKEVVEFGAAYVWVIDPETLESYVATKHEQYELRDGVFRIESMNLAVPLRDLEEHCS
ncbi:MAG TPA: Uma2 family endonuclease [Bryobacteraceae bacterium]|jgi:Uma2 family endonuclease